MTKQVDFYLMPLPTFTECLPFACQLIDKAYQQSGHLSVQLSSSTDQAELDALLWSFREDSFIPHTLEAPNSLKIGQKLNLIAASAASLVIHLKIEPSATPLNCQRLLQIVPNQPNLLDLARAHYRYYQQQSYLLNTHRIKASY